KRLQDEACCQTAPGEQRKIPDWRCSTTRNIREKRGEDHRADEPPTIGREKQSGNLRHLCAEACEKLAKCSRVERCRNHDIDLPGDRDGKDRKRLAPTVGCHRIVMDRTHRSLTRPSVARILPHSSRRPMTCDPQ